MNQSVRLGLSVLALILVGAGLATSGSNAAIGLTLVLAGGVSLTGAAIAHAPLAGALTGSVMGTLVSAYLAVQHHQAKLGGESVCNINETFNCDLVNTSEYSELFGIPIALLGLAVYVALAWVAAAGWRKQEGMSGAGAAVMVTAAASCVYSLYLAWASSQLGAWCILCMSTYALNAMLLLAGFLATRADGKPASKALMAKGDNTASTLVTVGLVVLAGSVFANRQLAPPPLEDAGYDRLYEQAGGVVALSGSEPVWGKPDAPYMLLEYADYECPHCAMMAAEVKALVSRYPELKVAHRHYPLSNECNPSMAASMHENACGAARAAVCAQEQGRFWQLNEQMFKNQRYLSPDDVLFMVEQLGMDKDAFTSCLNSERAKQRVAADVEAGSQANINSTPTLFLKGLVNEGEWVKVTMGSEGLELLLKAKAAGEELPAPAPAGTNK